MGADGAIALFFAVWALVCLFWLFTMVPFSVAVLFPEQRPRIDARDVTGLREALLRLNQRGHPFRLVPESAPTDLHLEWDVVDSSWYEIYARVKLTVVYRARIYLHEPKKELRYHEVIKSSSFFLGFDGMTPRFNFNVFYSSGIGDVIWSGLAYGIKPGWPPRLGEVYRFHLDTIWAKQQIERVTRDAGWAFRPVIWWFETTESGVRWGRRLSPPFMRDWSRIWFWATLYALSWALLIVTPVLLFPSLTPAQMLIGALVLGIIALGHVAIMACFKALRWAHARRVGTDSGNARPRDDSPEAT